MPNEHSARRRGRFIAPVSLHKQIHISALPNICIHIITHTYPHHQTRAFISSNTYIHITAHAFPFPITWVFTYMRHDKSAPTAANGLPITWRISANMGRTVCNNTTPTHKNHTFVLQKPTSCTANTILLHRKYPLFARQKPICDKLGGSQKRFVKIIIVAETNISHTQNKTLSSLLEYHFLNHYNRLYRVRITI